jgi:uncharacterized protein
MRDGVKLRATIFRPDAAGAFPAVLLRTPYGRPQTGFERYVRAGYAVVTQDSRGRYASEGEWVPFTEEHTGDAEDGYDSVEWLAAQPWCNGRVGTLGASYNAWMQWMLAKLRPPHLVAMCAYTIPLELTQVDWPGGFRPGRRIKWWLTTMAPDLRRRAGMPPPHTPEQARKAWDEGIEGEGHWIGFLPWKRFTDHLPPGLARYARDWLADPGRRAWKFDQVHAQVEVPNLDISGWYDHCNGSIQHLALMQANGRSAQAREGTRLIIGPWNHPGLGQRQTGDIDFGPQAEVDLSDQIIRFFDHWLKGLDNGAESIDAVRYFCMGTNQWRSASTWPPPSRPLELYFDTGADRPALSPTPAAKSGDETYQYDPHNPVPTLWGKAWFTGPADRRQVEHRQDIVIYRSHILEQDIEVAGEPYVVLYASSSAPDTDFFARLVDEHSDGEQALEICYGMVRARHRHGLERDELLKPFEVTEFRLQLGPTACRFAAGHRIRLEITSSDFPNHDRNHNTGGDDLNETQLAVAAQRIFHSPEQHSRLVLPLTE